MKLLPKQIDLSKDVVMKGGKIFLSPGTLAAPSLAFANNPATGMLMSAQSLALAVGGEYAFTVDPHGDLVMYGSGALGLHSGDTSERPAVPHEGMIRFNTDYNSLETYVDTEWLNVVTSNDTRLGTAQTIHVYASSNAPGTFTSVKAAVDSITDASATKHYVVEVDTGTFTEDPITLKPYVSIVGRSPWDTTIRANNPAANLFTAVSFSGIADCRITGATGTGASLVYYSTAVGSAGNYSSNSVMLHDVWFGDADTLVTVDHPAGGYGTVYVDGGIIGGGHMFRNGFITKNAGESRLNLRDLTTNGINGKIDTLFSGNGPATTIVVAGCTFRPTAGASTGVKVSNGAQVRMVGTSLLGFDVALWSINSGAAPGINAEGLNLQSNGQDLKLEHPGTTGHFSGSAERSKVVVDPACPITIFYSDPAATGITTVGPIYAGPTHATTINISDLIQYGSAVGLISGGVLSMATGLNIKVSAGYGYAERGGTSNPDSLSRLDWPDVTVALPANSNVFVYVTADNVWGVGSTLAAPTRNIVFGRVTTDATKVVYVEATSTAGKHPVNFLNRMVRQAIGPVYQRGSVVAENATTPFKLDVGSGTYFYGTSQFNPTGGYAITFADYYHQGGTWTNTSTSIVNSSQWDNGTDLVSMTPSYYAKHSLVLVGDGGYERYLLIRAQAEYASLVEVEAASIPTPPGFVGNSFVLLASIVVQQGHTNIVEIFDNRPQVGFKSPFLSAAATHSNLLGLDQDDHLQYLLVNGSRPMGGALDMGANNINNVGLVRGVNVASHASRHLPNGIDPLATAPAVGISLSSTNSAGTANSLARSDHTHVITGVQPQSADLSALAGVTGTGFLVRTGSGTATVRSLAVSSNLTLSNPTGVAGNPSLDLSTTGVAAGTYNNLTVDTFGRVTAASNVVYAQTITLSGDVTGTGSSTIATTLATVNTNTGNFGTSTSVPTLTVNGKGLITAVANTAIAFPVSSVNAKTGAVVLSTTDVSEGTNLYFTTARARSSISASGGTSYNSSTGVISTPVLATVATTGSYTDLLNKPTLTQVVRRTFTAADLIGAANGTLTVTHSIGQMFVDVTVYDKNNKRIDPDEITMVDTNSFTVNLSSFASDASGVSPTSTVIFNIVVIG